MSPVKRVLLLTEDEKLRDKLKPLAQWLDFHATPRILDTLEHLKDICPECFIVDVASATPMVQALLREIRTLPTYKDAPVIVIGDDPRARLLKPNHVIGQPFNLRRLEEAIADLLQIRLIGRGTHGPHRGSAY